MNNINTVVASKPITKNTLQDKETNHVNKVVVGGGPTAHSSQNHETVDHLSWRSQLFPHMEIPKKPKQQEHDSSNLLKPLYLQCTSIT